MTLIQNLVISVPRLEIHRPPISTAIVCNVIKQAGHPVEALDLNIKFFNYLEDSEKFYDLDDVWAGERPITKEEKLSIEKFISEYETEIGKYDRVFISVFGSWCHMFTEMVCKFIRKQLPNIEIVLGGQGVLTATIGKNAKHFGQIMKDAGLCDTFITGEGEKTIVEVLNKNLDVPGVNNVDFKQLNELDNLPFPDYGFYHLDEYDYLNEEKEVFIVGSRGCVRRCTYCDVARYWPNFRFRSGENLATEMISHYEHHGIKRFYFTDSLINGSIKAFHDMCNQLAEYNDKHNVGFKWGGQIIFRPPKQLPKDHYELVAKAGGDLFLVADGTITQIDLGATLYFLADTPLARMIDSHQVYFLDVGADIEDKQNKNNRLWQSKLNPSLDVAERLRRQIEIHRTAIKYNWPVSRGVNRVRTLKVMAKLYHDFLKNVSDPQLIEDEKTGLRWVS